MNRWYFFVWCLILGYLVIEWKYKTRSFGAFITPIAGHYPRFHKYFRRFDGDTAPCPGTAEQLASCACDNELHCLFGFCHSCAAALMYLAVTAEDRKSFPILYSGQ